VTIATELKKNQKWLLPARSCLDVGSSLDARPTARSHCDQALSVLLIAMSRHSATKHERKHVIEIDLSSPVGNAFVLIATMKNVARQLDLCEETQRQILQDMTKGTYIDLLNTMDSWFPFTFRFIGDPRKKMRSDRTAGAS
jgi:hypothetical protein